MPPFVHPLPDFCVGGRTSYMWFLLHPWAALAWTVCHVGPCPSFGHFWHPHRMKVSGNDSIPVLWHDLCRKREVEKVALPPLVHYVAQLHHGHVHNQSEVFIKFIYSDLCPFVFLPLCNILSSLFVSVATVSSGKKSLKSSIGLYEEEDSSSDTGIQAGENL